MERNTRGGWEPSSEGIATTQVGAGDAWKAFKLWKHFDGERNRGDMDNAKVFSLSNRNMEAEGGADSGRMTESLGLNV